MKASLLASVRFRTAGAYVLLIIVAFTLLGVFVLQRVERDFRRTAREDLASQARMARNVVAPYLSQGSPAAAIDSLAKQLGRDTGTRVTIIAPDGVVLGDSQADPATMENHLDRPEVQEAIRALQGASERTSKTVGAELTYEAVGITTPAGTAVVRLARPTSAISESLSSLQRSVAIAVVASGVAAAILGLAIATPTIRSLARMSTAARGIAAGNLRERITPRPAGEIGELAEAFNLMAQSLEEQMSSASQERNRLMAALNSSVDAVIAVDGERLIAFANAAAERLFSKAAAEMVGTPFSWALPNEAVLQALQLSLSEGRRQATTVERANRQHLQVTTTPIVGGGDWGALLVFHDLTEMRRAEQARRDFVANVSHELRTPLAAIKSVIETVAGGAIEDGETAREFLARADEEVDRVVEMVEELLELSRLESGQVPLEREPVDMGRLLARAVERAAPEAGRRGQTLRLEVADGLRPVLGDSRRLEQAVLNLLYNAIKFTPDDGVITVTATESEQGLTVSVADTGVGIAREDLSRVFERFYKVDRSRRSEGTGLGLAVVKHTVEAHGGSVAVESEPGRGSTFRFSIPVSTSPADR